MWASSTGSGRAGRVEKGADVRIGVISDTHGKLRDEVFAHFEGVDRILHAGDIGHAGILVELESIAPVTAVWGNTDHFEIRASVPEIARLELAGRKVVVVHGHQVGSPTPAALDAAYDDADIIVFGHTHRPLEERLAGRLYLNPGGAGAPRFGLPPSIMLLTVRAADDEVRLIEL
jgi:uncharacterized protein